MVHAASLLQVPFRRIHLTNGEHFDAYDTSGPEVRCSQAGIWNAGVPFPGHHSSRLPLHSADQKRDAVSTCAAGSGPAGGAAQDAPALACPPRR